MYISSQSLVSSRKHGYRDWRKVCRKSYRFRKKGKKKVRKKTVLLLVSIIYSVY